MPETADSIEKPGRAKRELCYLRDEHSYATCGISTARIASSKTAFRPRWLSAEHSRYFTARILLATARPCVGNEHFALSALSFRRKLYLAAEIVKTELVIHSN